MKGLRLPGAQRKSRASRVRTERKLSPELTAARATVIAQHQPWILSSSQQAQVDALFRSLPAPTGFLARRRSPFGKSGSLHRCVHLL
jgi:hypothetical protein